MRPRQGRHPSQSPFGSCRFVHAGAEKRPRAPAHDLLLAPPQKQNRAAKVARIPGHGLTIVQYPPVRCPLRISTAWFELSYTRHACSAFRERRCRSKTQKSPAGATLAIRWGAFTPVSSGQSRLLARHVSALEEMAWQRVPHVKVCHVQCCAGIDHAFRPAEDANVA